MPKAEIESVEYMDNDRARITVVRDGQRVTNTVLLFDEEQVRKIREARRG